MAKAMPEQSGLAGNTNTLPMKTRGKLIGFPGENQGLVAVPHYTGSKAHLNANGPEGTPGFAARLTGSTTRQPRQAYCHQLRQTVRLLLASYRQTQ
jgi:hypothetical protein